MHRFLTRLAPSHPCFATGEDDYEAAAPGELGPVVVKLPLPPGALPTLWHDEERFRQSYLATFPGYYHTVRAHMSGVSLQQQVPNRCAVMCVIVTNLPRRVTLGWWMKMASFTS